ncbi:MAG TPA: glycerate kinase, partial [Clostridium sp.]|nr:glycerate kinase [Clostridium sp.]
FSIINSAMTIEEAVNKETAIKNMTSTMTQIFRLIKTMKE